MQVEMYIENFLKSTDAEHLSKARERVLPLLDKKRTGDTVWLCALCYELGRREACGGKPKST